MEANRISVTSEIGPLRRVLIHSPDGGIGKVIPAKAQEWLYEDIVDLSKMQEEYDYFKKTLLAFLDPEKLKAWMALEKTAAKTSRKRPRAAVPGDKDFIDSDYVVEAQQILGYVLEDPEVRTRLVASICAIERCSYDTQELLLDPERFSPHVLAKVLITGDVGRELNEGKKSNFIFPPIPNFVFTRDIGITIGDRILLSKTANPARLRESIISKYLAYFYLLRDKPERIIEVSDDEEVFLCDDAQKASKVVTIEGGDVMMVHRDHLIVGCSERTSPNAIKKVIHRLFADDALGIRKVSVIVIPKQRSTMHIDTVFTQVSRDTWVLYAPWSRKGQQELRHKSSADILFAEKDRPEARVLKIFQFTKGKGGAGDYQVDESLEYLEDLLTQISCGEFGVKASDVKFIYSGDARFPFSEREQWTDACNLVAIREGIGIAYDRNYVTIDCFEKAGFSIVHAVPFIESLSTRYGRNPDVSIEQAVAELVPKRSVILLPSAELSRARGGSHCMTMPLLRDPIS